MKQFILKNKNVLMGIGAVLVIGGVTMSFQDSPLLRQKIDLQENYEDTLPEKNYEGSMKMKDLDRLAGELSKTLVEVGVELKKIDFSLIREEVEKALHDIDLKKIMKETELSLKNIDLNKIMADVRSSLKDINWDEKNDEIELAIKEAKKEIEKASNVIRNLDMTVVKKAMEQSRKAIEKATLDLKKLDMDKIMDQARNGIDKAMEELKNTKSMISEMEKDGLVDRKEGFSIEYKEKDLYINGIKQPGPVTDKYRKYFKEDHFKIKIDKE